MSIADAIRKNWLDDKDTISFLAIVLIIMMFMDVFEFIKKMSR